MSHADEIEDAKGLYDYAKQLELQIEALTKDGAAIEKGYTMRVGALERERDKYHKDLDVANRLVGEIPKKILEAVHAEQLRCGHIAEAFWNTDDKLNADLRANLTQAEKNMAYLISTQIRAMRWREENFTEKRIGEGEWKPLDYCHERLGTLPCWRPLHHGGEHDFR